MELLEFMKPLIYGKEPCRYFKIRLGDDDCLLRRYIVKKYLTKTNETENFVNVFYDRTYSKELYEEKVNELIKGSRLYTLYPDKFMISYSDLYKEEDFISKYKLILFSYQN